jgi:hypothetical protein
VTKAEFIRLVGDTVSQIPFPDTRSLRQEVSEIYHLDENHASLARRLLWQYSQATHVCTSEAYGLGIAIKAAEQPNTAMRITMTCIYVPFQSDIDMTKVDVDYESTL